MNNTLIDRPVGKLECLLEMPRGDKNANVLAVICHPHPQHGGTMTNKVVATIARTLQKMGATTVRFNYRGVGQSEGEYDNAVGEVDDLLAVVAWGKSQYPDYKLWLAGFSFGAYIAAKGATLTDAQQLISVAPSVENMDYHHLSKIVAPWLVVQGDADEVVSAQAVFDYVDSLDPHPRLIKMEGVGHFFHSRLLDLERVIIENLDLSQQTN